MPDKFRLEMGTTLGRFYGELARREIILGPIRENLKIAAPWQYISDRMLETNVVPNTNLLEISITDANPERAAFIANAVAEALIQRAPSSQESIAAQKQEVQRQIGESETRIEQLQARIDQLSVEIDQATSASDANELRKQRSEVELSLQEEQEAYRTLLGLGDVNAVNSLIMFDRASTPTAPLPSKRIVAIGSAGLAGLMLSLLAIFVLERLDNRWRNKRDIEDRLRLSHLGFIPMGPPILAASADFAQQREQSIRDAHTNILLAASGRGARSLLVTSPQPSEDRTGFTVDLAYLFARSGHRVLLVDAELSNPMLTHVLLPDHSAMDWSRMSGAGRSEVWAHLRPTVIPNVVLLPGRLGDGNGMPAMVPSLRWPDLVQQLMSAADVIIFDGPTTLSSADAALLAPLVDGVILTLDPAKDTREVVERTKDRLLHERSTRLLGAITFTPTGQPSGLRGFWKQLGSSPVLSLPAAAGQQMHKVDFSPPEPDEALVTPPPDPNVGPSGVYEPLPDEHDIVISGTSARSAARIQSVRSAQAPLRRRRRARADRNDQTDTDET
ncbi:MAG: lipopolysaccharide biosynthesis protein [Blastochloris sp.]|nr:lipopolysaccharide biosynthesis protein [Blastochloris sp.]